MHIPRDSDRRDSAIIPAYSPPTCSWEETGYDGDSIVWERQPVGHDGHKDPETEHVAQSVVKQVGGHLLFCPAILGLGEKV